MKKMQVHMMRIKTLALSIISHMQYEVFFACKPEATQLYKFREKNQTRLGAAHPKRAASHFWRSTSMHGPVLTSTELWDTPS